MAYFAKIGLDYEVLKISSTRNEDTSDADGNEVEQIGIDFLTKRTGYPYWVQTSYNKTFRKNYAGVGYRYDKDLDAFISPQPYSSWTLNVETCQWEAPTPEPTLAEDEDCHWNEEEQNWVLIKHST